MIYLFHGPDDFACSEALKELRATIPPDLAHLNSTDLDGRKLKIQDLAVACEALPFLADHRLVIVTDALKHTKAGKDRDALRDYLRRVPDTCILVFAESEDFDKRSSVYTYIKKHGQIREFQPRQGAELLRWLGDRATSQGARLERNAAQHLVDYVGNDSRTLISELDKLITYVGHGNRITTQVVELLVQDNQEYNLFTFIDNLSMRTRGAALQGIQELLADGQPIPYIVFMLARQVRILLVVQELAGQRLRADEIAAQLRQKPFVVRKALEQIRGFREDELRMLHDRLLELDHATKTGRVSTEVALDILIAEICTEESVPR